jgi:3'-5' exoribonuclease
MDQPALIEDVLQTPQKTFVRDLADGQAVESVFMVRDRTRRQRKSGDEFLKLQLGDVTGAVEAVVWDGVAEACEAATPGGAVLVCGRHSVDQRYGACITVRSIRQAASHEYDARELMEGPSVGFDQMVERLQELVSNVQDVHLRGLLETFFDESSETWRRWSAAPAAKTYHQAYRHGLFEHCLSVAEGVSALASGDPGIDKDLAVTGAILHDIGKIEAYGMQGGAIELTDAGKLLGEIPLGYYRIRRAIEDIPGFPEERAMALLHIILSHHGQLEHGSPVVPCTREATLVHFVDNLNGRLGSFDRLEKSLSDGERWSGFDRALSGSAFFASRAA